MIAGLPGTGIGGLFYAISTLWMPVKAARSKKARWGLAIRQILLSAGVVAMMWITGDIVGRILAVVVGRNHYALGGVIDPKTFASGKYNILTVPFLFWTLGSIVLLHVTIHGARLATRVARIRSSRDA